VSPVAWLRFTYSRFKSFRNAACGRYCRAHQTRAASGRNCAEGLNDSQGGNGYLNVPIHGVNYKSSTRGAGLTAVWSFLVATISVAAAIIFGQSQRLLFMSQEQP
jgi:hypothetical protein